MQQVKTLEQVMFEHVTLVIDACKGNMSKAADVLDVDRRTLYRMCERMRVPRPVRLRRRSELQPAGAQ